MAGSRRRLLAAALLGFVAALAACASTGTGGSLGDPAVLYVGWDGDDRPQLYRSAPDGSAQRALTSAPLGVRDFAVSPGGEAIVYSANREDGGSDLWRVAPDGSRNALLLACPEMSCDGAQWAPDGQRLVYTRRPLDAEVGSGPRLYWLAWPGAATQPLFADERQMGLLPRFSARGDWLAFVRAGGLPSVLAYPLDGGEPVELPGDTAAPAAWHPFDLSFLSSVVLYEGESTYTHLFAVQVETQAIEDLSGVAETEDTGAVWSPDGEWIAFARKVARAPVGKQVWLMRADGSEARPLTSDPESNYSNLSWSADGETLLLQRFAIVGGSRPEVWLLAVESGELSQVARPASAPVWLAAARRARSD